MAGFTGGRRPLGVGGYPPAPPPAVVSLTATPGTDTYYIVGFDLSEDPNPTGSSNSPVRITENGSVGTDTFYTIGMVLAESASIGPLVGNFRITEQGTVGSDTYYVIGIVLSEH